MKRALLGVALLSLASCVGTKPAVAPPEPVATPLPLPKVQSFGKTEVLPPQRSNADMAQDFLDLSFQLESGQALPILTRFEGPITVAVTGLPSPALEKELKRLLKRFSTEAGLDIHRVSDPAKASIVVEGVTTQEMQRNVPEAACFVLPTRVTWEEFRRVPRSPDYAWSRLKEREALSVFVPIDTSQQEIRDCLHEEIAQGLGPLNDLYRLGDSVFNDDNLNPILTGFDMLMLRVTYAGALQSGMTRAEVARRLPPILAALNPSGETIPSRHRHGESEAWNADISRALSGGSLLARRSAAERAVQASHSWQDARSAYSLYTLGRLTMSRDGDAALDAFLSAGDIYRRRPETQVHAAHVGFHVAAIALNSGQLETAVLLADRYMPTAREWEDAALLSDLMLIKAAALAAEGQPDPELRQDGLGWGLYAYGSADRALERATEIESLIRRSGT